MGALHLAKYGASGVARLLLARGAQPDAPGKSHITPLHMATYYGHPDIALLLLDKERQLQNNKYLKLEGGQGTHETEQLSPWNMGRNIGKRAFPPKLPISCFELLWELSTWLSTALVASLGCY
ncbi:hypothetical protein NE865_10823 [Phthorimaea operculella]|nr:hypothetical protein NE865_10823 [Phthorimaea operculella]